LGREEIKVLGAAMAACVEQRRGRKRRVEREGEWGSGVAGQRRKKKGGPSVLIIMPLASLSFLFFGSKLFNS